MKKLKYTLLLAITFGLICGVKVQAQGETVQDPNLLFKSLEKRFANSDKQIVHPKKSLKASTWIKRGDLLIDIFNNDQNPELLKLGTTKERVKIYFKEPDQETTEMVNNENKEVFIYPRLKVYFTDNLVTDWKVTEMVTEKPLFKAYEAFKKAIELDPESAEKISSSIDKIKSVAEREAAMDFRRRDYEEAMANFELIYNVVNLKPEAERYVDTASIYNAGLAASNAKKYDKAIEYFSVAKKYNYGGSDLYILMKDAYIKLGDTTKILPLLKDGFQQNPDSKDLIVELTNYYLNTGQEKEALEYIKLAKEKDPNNVSYYDVEGSLYDKMGEIDKAIVAYEAAIDMDPERFIAYYNLGVIHWNFAVSYIDTANSQPNTTKGQKDYEKYLDLATKELEKAVPYMSKGLEIAEKEYKAAPNDKDALGNYKGTLETLKNIYFRLRNTSEEYKKNLEAVEAKLKSLKQQG